jgi:hypothetical protein
MDMVKQGSNERIAGATVRVAFVHMKAENPLSAPWVIKALRRSE